MPELQTSPAEQELNGFLDYLTQARFPCGVGERVRAFKVWRELANENTERSRTLLAPIFARSAPDQERFYDAYRRYFDLDLVEPIAFLPPRHAPPVPEPDPSRPKRFRWRPFVRRHWWILAGSALVLLIAASLLTFRPKEIKPPPPNPDSGSDTNKKPVISPERVRVPRPCAGWECLWAENRAPKVASPFLLSILAFGLVRLSRRSRVIQNWKTERLRPPFSWPLICYAPPLTNCQGLLNRTAELLRVRLSAISDDLDISRTISATIQAAGFPSFRFRSRKRHLEHLFLIEQRAENDHYTEWWLDIARQLRGRGVSVDCYRYSGDLRRCYPERSRTPISTQHLLDALEHRSVIVFGNVGDLLHPFTGEFYSWVDSSLVRRDQRAVMTARASFDWGAHEHKVSAALPLAPARIENMPVAAGVSDLAHGWLGEAVEMPSIPSEYFEETEESAEGSRPSFAMFLEPDVFQWLCACAVYPKLEWELTLQIGRQVDGSGNLFEERKLLQLMRLPWFREGRIPDHWRAWLIKLLKAKNGDRVREFLADALRASRPPKGSLAAEFQQEQLAAISAVKPPADWGRKSWAPAWPVGLVYASAGALASFLVWAGLLNAPVTEWQMRQVTRYVDASSPSPGPDALGEGVKSWELTPEGILRIVLTSGRIVGVPLARRYVYMVSIPATQAQGVYKAFNGGPAQSSPLYGSLASLLKDTQTHGGTLQFSSSEDAIMLNFEIPQRNGAYIIIRGFLILPPLKFVTTASGYSVTGGTPPYKYSIQGQLPAGFTLYRDGKIRGKCATPGGVTQFNVVVTDSTGASTNIRDSIDCSPEVVTASPVTFDKAPVGGYLTARLALSSKKGTTSFVILSPVPVSPEKGTISPTHPIELTLKFPITWNSGGYVLYANPANPGDWNPITIRSTFPPPGIQIPGRLTYTATPDALNFTFGPNDPPTQTKSIAVTISPGDDVNPLPVRAATLPGWLRLQPDSKTFRIPDTLEAQVQVTAQKQGVNPGTYTFDFEVGEALPISRPARVRVNMTVEKPVEQTAQVVLYLIPPRSFIRTESQTITIDKQTYNVSTFSPVTIQVSPTKHSFSGGVVADQFEAEAGKTYYIGAAFGGDNWNVFLRTPEQYQSDMAAIKAAQREQQQGSPQQIQQQPQASTPQTPSSQAQTTGKTKKSKKSKNNSNK